MSEVDIRLELDIAYNMALTVLSQPDTLPEIIQLPLPNPDTIPAWVHAALDRWNTSRATYLGLDVLKMQYGELQSAYENPMERDVFRKLRCLAISWQNVGYRTYITSFEKMLLDIEIKALRNPLSTRRSDTGNYLDLDWILNFMQRELGGYNGGKRHKREAGIAMGKRHILATLDGISAVYMCCETLGLEVKVVSSHRTEDRANDRKVLHKGLQFAQSA